MVILEVILAVCGILCIAASFLLTEDEQKTSEQANNRKRQCCPTDRKRKSAVRSMNW